MTIPSEALRYGDFEAVTTDNPLHAAMFEKAKAASLAGRSKA